jgi:CxxC-x17-CxxC domain-containing protein
MEYLDQVLACRDCGAAFTWTAGEQQFFHEKGLTNLPVRCASCRSARKAKMGIQDRAQTEIVCAECGQMTTVPFVPRNGNPVYCSRCFDRIRNQQTATMTG